MSEEKYIRVDEMAKVICPICGVCSGENRDPLGCEILDRFLLSVPTYTPADILAGCWVPASNPPKKAGRYHIFLKGGDQGTAYFDGHIFVGFVGVTHWMPLAAAPKEDSHGE